MNIKYFNSSILIILLVNLYFFSFSQEKPKEINLKFIETTDVHGSVFPYDFLNEKNRNYSLASVYNYVMSERKNQNQEVVLLDNGDILQGQPIVYYSNFEDTVNQHICAAVMNFMKYDAATIGNHDIEAGHPVYDKLVKEFNFPWLAANVVNIKTGEPYFLPYKIIEKQGVRIAILGLITPSIPNWLPENIWKGMKFEDMIESAKKWVKIIKEKEKADIIIGMFHSGVDYTYGGQSASSYKNENASQLVAEQVNGFDAVFAGHDHRQYNKMIKNGDSIEVLLVDPGSHAQKVGAINIRLIWDENKGEYQKSKSGELVDMTGYQPDSGFIKYFDNYYINASKYVNRIIGKCYKTVSATESLFGDSEFIDFIQQVQLEISKADISFASPLSYDFEIKEGDISVNDMFKLYRFENLLYSMELTGQEIKDYLEYSADLWFNQMHSQDEPMIKYYFNEKGEARLTNPYYNFSSAAGIIYTLDLTQPGGKKIKIKGLENGKPFSLSKKYKVAINSYRGNGGGGHLTKGAGIAKEELKNRIIFSTDKDLRYYMIKYIEKIKEIKPTLRKNWKIIPEKWWEIAKNKEIQLINKR